MRSITGYLDSEFHRAFDQDVTQIGLYETYAGRRAGTFSEELRLHVQNERIDWTTGGLYARDGAHDFNVSPIGPDGFAFATLNPNGKNTFTSSVISTSCFIAALHSMSAR